MLEKFWNNEAGFVLSAELVLVHTIAVLGMVVGLSHVTMAVCQELTDAARAVGALNQSYSFTGFVGCSFVDNDVEFITNSTAGSAFLDAEDICDDGICTDVATCDTAKEAAHP